VKRNPTKSCVSRRTTWPAPDFVGFRTLYPTLWRCRGT